MQTFTVSKSLTRSALPLKPPVFRPVAAADLDDAFRWYERQRVGLGEEFLGAVGRTLDSIAEKPELYPIIHRDTRPAYLKRCTIAYWASRSSSLPVITVSAILGAGGNVSDG